MKKLLCLLMAVIILTVSVPTVSFAEEVDTLSTTVTEDIFTRNGNKHAAVLQTTDYLVIDSGRTSYLKFNVSALKAAMNGKDAKYTLQFTSYESTAVGSINVYGISGENRTNWSESTLNYNIAYRNGLDADESNFIGTVQVTAKNAVSSIDVTKYILSVPEDGIATLKLQNKSSNAVVMVQSKENGTAATITAKRTYAEGTEAVFDGIEIPSITSDNLVLPTVGAVYGSTLSWSSSHPDVIAADGTVTPQSEDVTVTLTATYVGYSNIQKNFEVIVLDSGTAVEATVSVAEDIFTRIDGQGGTVQPNSFLVVDIGRTSYLKFNVSDLKTAMNGRNAKYTLSFTTHNDTKTGDVNIYGITGNNRNSWTENDLCYDKAAALGMDTDLSNLLATVPVTAGNTVLSVDVTDYIKKIPEDGIAAFKLQNKAIPDASRVMIQTKEAGTGAQLSAKISMEEEIIPEGEPDTESVIMQMDFNDGTYDGLSGAGSPGVKVVNGEKLGRDNKALEVTKKGGDFWTIYTPLTSYKTGIQHMTTDFYIPSGEITGQEYLVMCINNPDGKSCTGFWVEFSEGNNGTPLCGYGKLVTDYPRDSWFTLHYKFDYYRGICEVSLIHNNTEKIIHSAFMNNTSLMTNATGGLRQFRLGGKAVDMTFYNDNVKIYEDIWLSSEDSTITPDVTTMLELDYENYEAGIKAPSYETLNYSEEGGRALVVTDPDDEHNNVLMLQQDGYASTIAYWNHDAFTGKNVFSARVRTDDENGSKIIGLRSGKLSVPSFLEIKNDRLLSMGVDIGKCESGKWYDLVALFDNDEHTMMVYLDGKPVRYMKLGAEFDAAQFTRLDFRVTGWYANRATLYVDNIYHYKFENSSTSAIVSLLNEKQNANSVKLLFTNEMKADTVTAETVKVANAEDYTVSYGSNKSEPRTAEIYFKTPLEYGKTYEISFDNVKDIFGNTLTAEPISFTVTDNSISVSDYVKMLLDGLEISYDDEISKAVELGIVKTGEIQDKTLPILKKQAVSMAIRSISEEYRNDLAVFSDKINDIDSVEESYKTDAVKAYSKGIADLYAGSFFGGEAKISESEASEIITKTLNPEKRNIPVKVEPKFSLPSVFGDNMVLQQGETIPVYGFGEDGENVQVKLGDATASATVTDGKWKVNLPSVPVGGPYELTVSGSEKADTVVLDNVLVGEVWLVSGQSNAALMAQKAMTWADDKLNAVNPNLRLFTQTLTATDYEKADTTGVWHESNAKTAGDFSAVGYYFADKLQKDLGVPVGIINASKSGSWIDAWMPEGTVPDGFNSVIKNQYYNGMISALTDFGISGVLWYQGESNATEAYKELYEDALEALITTWRSKWQKELSFLIVQLPPYTGADLPLYHYVRESSMNIVNRLNGVGMVATSDIELGGTDPLHPTNKKPVGERLALLAKGMNYGYEEEYSMPLYQGIKIDGNKAIVKFSHTGDGLYSDGELTGFKICGADKVFVDAKAEIVGDTVHVYSEAVENPVAVRYFFEAVTEGINLYNSIGMPASPFRSDNAIDCYTVSITNAEGNKAESLNSGDNVIANIELTNNNSKKGKTGLFVAIAEYNDISLSNVTHSYVDISGGENKTVQIPFTVKNNGAQFKVFVWENSSQLVPVRAITLDY